MSDIDRALWEIRMERCVKSLLIVAVLGVIVTIANAVNVLREKSVLEQRIEILEESERTNRIFKKGVSDFMEEMINGQRTSSQHR